MQLELFKPENFKQMWYYEDIISIKEATDKANKLLNDYIETLPKVYGTTTDSAIWVTENAKHDRVTASARIICTEEIKPKFCEHNHFSIVDTDFKFNGTGISTFKQTKKQFICYDCNKTLKPNWTTDEK